MSSRKRQDFDVCAPLFSVPTPPILEGFFSGGANTPDFGTGFSGGNLTFVVPSRSI